MGFKLKSRESLADGASRIIFEQLRAVKRALDKKHPSSESIHVARTSIKKARALLRLIRSYLGREFYQKEDKLFRKIAQELGPLRDAQVVLRAVTNLRKGFARREGVELFDGLSRKLEKQQRTASAPALSRVRDRIDPVLKQARARARKWPIGELRWDHVYAGLKRTYKQGQRKFAAVLIQPGEAQLHSWRKRVKDLSYHLRVLRGPRMDDLASLTVLVTELGERLGDDHDLAMLARKAGQARLSRQSSNRLRALIAARRLQMQRAAFRLGFRLYGQRPKSFVGYIVECRDRGRG